MQNAYDQASRKNPASWGVRNYIGKWQRVLEETDPFRWK